jgi:predicted nucleotidyltransferase
MITKTRKNLMGRVTGDTGKDINAAKKLKVEEKLTRAIEYLKSIGCSEIILFGSLADGMADESSDIDLAVSGISPRTYF